MKYHFHQKIVNNEEEQIHKQIDQFVKRNTADRNYPKDRSGGSGIPKIGEF